MAGDVTSWAALWCEDMGDAGASVAADPALFAAVNGRWQVKHDDAPASLLQALSKAEERRLAATLAAHVQADESAATASIVSRLHRVFVSQFDPGSEQEACRAELRAVEAVRSGAELVRLLADLTRSGYGSPMHLQVRHPTGKQALVVPRLHPAPLPPTDFDTPDRSQAYVKHMSVMVGHIGGHLAPERLRKVLTLDRALWSDLPSPDAAAADQSDVDVDLPWSEFLPAAVGGWTQAWRPRVSPEVRRRMAAWWSQNLDLKRDWIVCRLAYDLGPFTCEEALTRNSRFFAGRVLGLTTPRSREQRFVSFVKTVAPAPLVAMYVRDRHAAGVLARAHEIVEALRVEAVAWTAATDMSGALEPGARRVGQVVVELGWQPSAADDATGECVLGRRGITSSVCAAIKAARSEMVVRQLSAIDDPSVDTAWRVEPFTAAAYYQAASNKIIVPWALMQEPLLAAGMAELQAFAMFGTIVAHEMAHAALPASADDWVTFVDAAGLGEVVDLCAERVAQLSGSDAAPSAVREIAADAIGLLWTWRALDHRGRAVPADFDRFLRYWATRWRGVQRRAGASSAHLDHHPPAEVRCDVAAIYVQHDALRATAKDGPTAQGGRNS